MYERLSHLVSLRRICHFKSRATYMDGDYCRWTIVPSKKKKNDAFIIVLLLEIFNRIEKWNGIRRWQVTWSANAHILEVSFRLSIIIYVNDTYARERTLFLRYNQFSTISIWYFVPFSIVFQFVSTEPALLDTWIQMSKCHVYSFKFSTPAFIHIFLFFIFSGFLRNLFVKIMIYAYCRYVFAN